MSARSKLLGLAIGQKNILVAEIVQKGDRYVVTHVGDFSFPEDVSLSQPDRLGEALSQFLKQNKFSTKDAVIGLPAKRLITRRKEVPAASAAVAASSLRLQVEGEFSSELDNLIMDFAGTPSTSEPTGVLLIATNKVLVDECSVMAKAAGLRVTGVTSTTVAMGRTTSRLPGGDGYVLSLAQNAAELIVQHGRDPAHLRHLNVVGGAEALAGEIRRTLASIPRNGTPATLALWDGGSGESRSVLEQRLSMPVNLPELRKLVATDTTDAERFFPAIALALTAMEPAGLPINFLNSRLAPPREPIISRTKMMVLIGAIVLVFGALLAYFDMDAQKKELDRLTTKVNKAKTDHIDQADLDIKRFDQIQGLIGKGPHFVTVLRDLTEMFTHLPNNTIWATQLSNHGDSYSWTLEGKSYNPGDPGRLRDMFLNNKERYEAAGVQYRRETTGEQLYSWTLNFTLAKPKTGPAATTAPARGGRK